MIHGTKGDFVERNSCDRSVSGWDSHYQLEIVPKTLGAPVCDAIATSQGEKPAKMVDYLGRAVFVTSPDHGVGNALEQQHRDVLASRGMVNLGWPCASVPSSVGCCSLLNVVWRDIVFFHNV